MLLEGGRERLEETAGQWGGCVNKRKIKYLFKQSGTHTVYCIFILFCLYTAARHALVLKHVYYNWSLCKRFVLCMFYYYDKFPGFVHCVCMNVSTRLIVFTVLFWNPQLAASRHCNTHFPLFLRFRSVHCLLYPDTPWCPSPRRL